MMSGTQYRANLAYLYPFELPRYGLLHRQQVIKQDIRSLLHPDV